MRGRLEHTPQITTDGFDAYFRTVRRAFGWDVDYGAVLKAAKGEQSAIYVTGEPDPSYLHTSYVERHNLTLRSSMRRYTKRTIGYSWKLSNHKAMLAFWMYAYNFIQPHRSRPSRPKWPSGPWAWRASSSWSTRSTRRRGCGSGVLRGVAHRS